MTGPIVVVTSLREGVLDENLRTAALAALALDRVGRRTALSRTWEKAAAQFMSRWQDLIPAAAAPSEQACI